jgi:ABC-type branched-subunit amino acid transport system permease subunit
MAGVTGAFWVSNTAALSPEHFPWFWSLWLVGVILIGGVGSIHGAIFGSIFMVVVMELPFSGPLSPLANTFQTSHGLFRLYKGYGFWSGHLRLPDLRAQRACLPVVADQELFQPVAVFY